MACIHCALVQGYLLTLIVPALLGRHLAIGLGLASGGGVHRENARVGFYVVWGTWEAPDTSKRILILVQEIFFCQWKRIWFATYIIQFQALSGRFAVTLKVQLSFRRFELCADILPITAGPLKSTISACLLTWGMSCWDPWRTPGMILSLGFQSHHMLLTS